MQGLFEVRNISVSIRCRPADVYAFIASGENIPRWAKGLATTARRVGDEWQVDGPLGTATVRFAPSNELGVADHDVTLETGATVHNPIRVVPNGTGSTVVFTLLRLPDMSDEKFEEDADAVAADLEGLKALLEQT